MASRDPTKHALVSRRDHAYLTNIRTLLTYKTPFKTQVFKQIICLEYEPLLIYAKGWT